MVRAWSQLAPDDPHGPLSAAVLSIPLMITLTPAGLVEAVNPPEPDDAVVIV